MSMTPDVISVPASQYGAPPCLLTKTDAGIGGICSARPAGARARCPPGLVIVIVVVGLLAAALLNADATLRKSKSHGDGFRQDVAGAVANVSDTLGLSGGRNRMDEALGRDIGPAVDVEQLLDEQQAPAGTERR